MKVFLVLWVVGIASGTWGPVDPVGCEVVAARHNAQLESMSSEGVRFECRTERPEIGDERP
jgi:hypothetical protein